MNHCPKVWQMIRSVWWRFPNEIEQIQDGGDEPRRAWYTVGSPFFSAYQFLSCFPWGNVIGICNIMDGQIQSLEPLMLSFLIFYSHGRHFLENIFHGNTDVQCNPIKHQRVLHSQIGDFKFVRYTEVWARIRYIGVLLYNVHDWSITI